MLLFLVSGGLAMPVGRKERKEYARQLKRNRTPTERRLNQILRSIYRRATVKQQIILGFYIVDLVMPDKNLIIELDGVSHKDRQAYDTVRDIWLRSCGFNVVRFTNQAVWKDHRAILSRLTEFTDDQREAYYAAREKAKEKARVSLDAADREFVLHRRKKFKEAKRARALESGYRTLGPNGERIRPRCECGKPLTLSWRRCKQCGKKLDKEKIKTEAIRRTKIISALLKVKAAMRDGAPPAP